MVPFALSSANPVETESIPCNMPYPWDLPSVVAVSSSLHVVHHRGHPKMRKR